MYLRCSAGSVEWMYPTGALIVNLRPNTFSPSRHLTVCIKPFRDSSGANIYLEKTGELRLLVRDGDSEPGRVQCFSLERGGLFVEATPQQDISRRATGFQYELMSGHRALDLHMLTGKCPGGNVGTLQVYSLGLPDLSCPSSACKLKILHVCDLRYFFCARLAWGAPRVPAHSPIKGSWWGEVLQLKPGRSLKCSLFHQNPLMSLWSVCESC